MVSGGPARRNVIGRAGRQTLLIYASMVLALLAGLGASVVTTRVLGPKRFGELAFVQGIWEFVGILFPLGLFVSASRLLALENDFVRQRRILGATYSCALSSSLLAAAAFFLFSFSCDSLFHNDQGAVVRLFSPFLFVLVFHVCLQETLKGANHIAALSLLQVGPRVLYFAGVLAISCAATLTVERVLALQLLAAFAVALPIVLLSRPVLQGLRASLTLLARETLSYGFPVYTSTIASVATAKLATVFIAYYVPETQWLGFYALAVAIASPLALFPNAAATSLFRRFASSDRISPRALTLTLAFSSVSTAALFVACGFLVELLYSEEYLPVAGLARVVCLACAFHGVGDLFNRFLGAHGKGKILRNSVLAVGGVNLVGYAVLVGLWGVWGAAITALTADAAYCALMAYHYRKLSRALRGAEPVSKPEVAGS